MAYWFHWGGVLDVGIWRDVEYVKREGGGW